MQSSASTLDEDRPCNVCFSKLAEPGNEMIFCDGCDVCVHQACYGVLRIPDGDWFCDRCAVKAEDEPCVLCPVYEGAMKRTEQGSWCHCSCVWWIPEVHFKDTILMRPVMGVPDVPKSRFSLKCIFCDTNNGACIQCAHKSCRKAFHVTCAFATKESTNGATFLMYEESEWPDELKRKAFCPTHRQEQIFQREKVKLQITGSKSQSDQTKVINKVPSSKICANDKQHRPSIIPPNHQRAASPLASDGLLSSNSSKHSRREHSVQAVAMEDDQAGQSTKYARKSINNNASAEDIRFLKMFRHASVDTQDHPCTSLLPPLLRLVKESSSNSLLQASNFIEGSIFSSMEGSFE